MQTNSYSKMGKASITHKDVTVSEVKFPTFNIVKLFFGYLVLQVILTFLVSGVVFIPLGVICLFASQGVCFKSFLTFLSYNYIYFVYMI